MPGKARRWRAPAAIKASAVVHVAAVGAAVGSPAHWPFALGAIALNHGLLAAAGFVPRSGLLGPNITRLPARAAAAGAIALTFDDGPDPEITPRVLDLLEAAGARASFFCVGERVARHPGIASRIVAGGHSVENHSHRHATGFAWMPPRRLRRELRAAQHAIADATGRAPGYFRAPFGIRNPWLDPVLAMEGLHYVSWSTRAFDTVRNDARRVARAIGNGVRAGAVLLLHDGRATGLRHAQPSVLDALPEVLARIREHELETVTLPEAFAPAGGRDG
ncbi:MAG: polysaccharide deacetylase family protein [Burkholderiaceae bacterium]